MSEDVRITMVVENSVQRSGLRAEHGLSFHVQIGHRNLLFDTGQTDLALINGGSLGIELSRLDAIVLSHGHYDHTGGLLAVLAGAPAVPVYLHPAAFESKYSTGANGVTRFIGMNPATANALYIRKNYIETISSVGPLAGVMVTGEIPRTNSYENTGGAFFLDAEGTRPDPLLDDQALVIDLGRSVVLLLGCAHAGVVNTLDQVAKLTGGKPVRAVIGGFHLGSASEERIGLTIARLRAANLDLLAPVHCTGWPARARLWQAFLDTYRAISVGETLEFKRD